jgi:NADPH2:quinone reductase
VLARAGDGYGGGYADTVIAAPEATYPVPEGLDLRSAMAVMDDGSTAAAPIEATPVHRGERVVVVPGAGGLGNLLVQLLLRAGAEVIAGVRGAAKLDAARNLGAVAVDYADPGWPERAHALTAGHGVDVVFDGIGGAVGAAAASLLVDGGRFSGYGMSSGAETVVDEGARRLSVVGTSQLPGFWADSPRRVRQVLSETAAGRLARSSAGPTR